MIINILIASITTFICIVAIFKTSDYLSDKPKTNKFRQWWSNHICDLDNKYEE